MARPKNKIPSAKLQLRGEKYRIYWGGRENWTGFSLGDYTQYQAEEALAEVQLALMRNEWPTWCREIPAIQQYALNRSLESGEWNTWTQSLKTGSKPEEAASQKHKLKVGDLLNEYIPHLESKVSDGHAKVSIVHIQELREYIEKKHKGSSLLDCTPAIATEFLHHLITTPKKIANHKKGITRSKTTANRIKSSCSRFFKWCVVNGRKEFNPFSADAGVEGFTIKAPDEIQIFSVVEREQILANIDQAGLDDNEKMVVMLAVYTGMRRGEIMVAEWSDVSLDNELMETKQDTKTGKRIFPLNSKLVKYLLSVPEKKRKGCLVNWNDGYHNWARNGKLMLEKLADYHSQKHEGLKEIDADLFKFYTFRHTFASHLVQAGVSIDKVAAWLGNSIDVCRKHYARFIPKDQKDNDIDKI